MRACILQALHGTWRRALAARSVGLCKARPARDEQQYGRRGTGANCGAEEYELGRLAKPIDQEIEFQTRLIREEDLSVQNVLESHRKLISENNIAVNSFRSS